MSARRHFVGRFLVGTLLAIALGALLPAASAAHGPDPILGGGTFGPNHVLKFRWTGSPPAAWKSAVLGGVGDANASRTSKAATFQYDAGGGNAVYYGPTVPCGVNGLACMRRSAPDGFGIWYRENGHRFDWGTLRWCELSGSPNGCYEVENVMLDELGHVEILDHHANFADDSDYDDAVVQTYSRTKPQDGWNAHSFARCDIATLQQQYDVPYSATLYSTCLDIPSRISLAASDTSVAEGARVVFTATLKSDGSDLLDGNAVSNRTVVLQQRLTSGWSDLATMPPGSAAGSYVLGVTTWASRDYRAVFRKPSNEGLRGSTSGTVSIAVAPCLSQCPLSAPSR
jgi:hypothetical protein